MRILSFRIQIGGLKIILEIVDKANTEFLFSRFMILHMIKVFQLEHEFLELTAEQDPEDRYDNPHDEWDDEEKICATMDADERMAR